MSGSPGPSHQGKSKGIRNGGSIDLAMSDRGKLSVCMATFNGENYVRDQLASILGQLGEMDEVIIVDDHSTDSTVAQVEALKDRRIKLIVNQYNEGHVKAFERALGLAGGRFIFLADQDDIWLPNRVETMVRNLIDTQSALVSSSYSILGNPNMRGALLQASDSPKKLRNMGGVLAGRRPYFGCTMALERSLLNAALPFPPYVKAHDLWLAMVANARSSNFHLEQTTVLRRLHERNLTKAARPLQDKIIDRIWMTRAIFEAIKRA